MNEEILKEETNIYTTDQKLSWFGYGEWIEESDKVTFAYRGMEAEILRAVCKDGRNVFGGHLCGYVIIPIDIDIGECGDKLDVHGGITFDKVKNGEIKIGFDCAHCFDIRPSMERLYKTDPDLIRIRKKYPNSLIFERSYKNINFCIDECKKLINQIINLKIIL